MARSQRDTRRMNQFVSIAAAVAGLLLASILGDCGALPFITDHFVLSSRLQEWVVSSMMLGAAIGALFNGWLSFRLGRKYSLMVGRYCLSPDQFRIGVCRERRNAAGGRIILGAPWGSPPAYRAAVSFWKWRAKTCAGKMMISMYQLMVTLGSSWRSVRYRV